MGVSSMAEQHHHHQQHHSHHHHFRSTWSMVTDWSRRLGGRSPLLKSMFPPLPLVLDTKLQTMDRTWHIKDQNSYRIAKYAYVPANRFLGLEAQVTQENFYFNATKVILLQKKTKTRWLFCKHRQSLPSMTKHDDHQGFHCLRPGRGPERCLAKSKGRPHVNVTRWSPPPPPSSSSLSPSSSSTSSSTSSIHHHHRQVLVPCQPQLVMMNDGCDKLWSRLFFFSGRQLLCSELFTDRTISSKSLARQKYNVHISKNSDGIQFTWFRFYDLVGRDFGWPEDWLLYNSPPWPLREAIL